MRIQAALLTVAPLLVLSACDGGMGGNIKTSEHKFDAAALEADRVERVVYSLPEIVEDEVPDEPVVDDVPEDVPVETAPEVEEPKPKPKPSGGGGRRGRGGGSHTGTVVATDAGSAAAGTAGTIVGLTLFEGTPPARAPLSMIEETQGCAEHANTPLNEEVIVNDGKLANVFVYLKSIPADVTIPPPPTEPLVLDQVGCVYVPHIAGIQAGRPLQAANSDQATHNVRATGIKYAGDNKSMGAGAANLDLPIPEQEEFAINFNCDIHPWMNAKVVVLEHPWFAVSAEDGSFTIENVPPGTYAIEAWHEKYKKAKCAGDVVVGPGGQVTVNFTYKP